MATASRKSVCPSTELPVFTSNQFAVTLHADAASAGEVAEFACAEAGGARPNRDAMSQAEGTRIRNASCAEAAERSAPRRGLGRTLVILGRSWLQLQGPA